MNEKTKYIGIAMLAVFLGVAVYWYMFRDIHTDGTTTADVGIELESVAAEQRGAEESLDRINTGLDDSLAGIGRIEESNRSAEAAATTIGESNSRIKATVIDAQDRNSKCAEILADSERRIKECQSVLQEVRSGAGTVAK